MPEWPSSLCWGIFWLWTPSPRQPVAKRWMSYDFSSCSWVRMLQKKKMLKMIHENEKIYATYVLVDSRPESRPVPEDSKHIRSAVKWNSINIQLYTKQFTNLTMKKIFFNSPRLKNTGPSPIRSLKFHCSPSLQHIFLGLFRINHCIQHSQKTFFKWNCIVASGVPEVITPSIIHPFSLFFC